MDAVAVAVEVGICRSKKSRNWQLRILKKRRLYAVSGGSGGQRELGEPGVAAPAWAPTRRAGSLQVGPECT